MIAACPECTARFRIPDEKMKPGGVKVRCSKCNHVFTADANDGGPTATGTPLPAPTPVPSMPGIPDLAPGGAGPVQGAGVDYTAAISLEEAQRAASQNLSMGLPLVVNDLGPPPVGPAPASTPAGDGIAPSLDLGAPPSIGPSPGGAFDIAPAPGPAPGKAFTDIAHPPGAGPGPAPGPSRGAPDIGGSISLDDSPGATAPLPAAISRRRASGPDMRASDHNPLATRSSVGMLLFMILLAFNGLCAYVLFKNDWRADLRRAGDMFRVAMDAEDEVMLPAAKPPVPRLELTGVRARTLVNDEDKTILIIDGLAKNSGDVAVRDVLIAGRLIDVQQDNTVIRKATSPATGRLAPDVLRAVRSLSDVHRAFKGLTRGKAAGALLPGEEAPFTTVFPNLPDDFVQAKERYRFEVQIGSYEEAIEGGNGASDGEAKADAGAAGDPDDADDKADETEDSEAGDSAEEFMGPPAPAG